MRLFITYSALLFFLLMAGDANGQKTNNEEASLRSLRHLVDGIASIHLGELQEAVAQLKAAMKADPNNHAAAFYLSQIAARMGDYNYAISLAEQSTQLAPDNAWYWEWLAQLYLHQHRLQEAVNAYWQAIHTGNAPTKMYFALLEICKVAHKWDEALTALDTLEHKLGTSPSIYAERAYILLAKKQHSLALQTIQEGLERFPTDTTLMLGKVRLLAHLDQKEQALSYLDSLPPTLIPPHIKTREKIKLLTDMGRVTEALLALKEFAQMPEGNPREKLQLVELLGREVNANKEKLLLRQVAESIATIHSKMPEAWAILGDITNELLDSPQLAIPAYLRAIEADSFYAYAWLKATTTYLKIDSTKKAYQLVVRATRLFPENPFFPVIGAHSCYMMKNWECVVTFGEKALLLNVDARTAEDLLVIMGDSYYFLGNYERSDSSYEKALKLNPHNDVALNNYAYFLIVREKNLDKAKKMIKKALKAKPAEPSYLDTYGWYWYKKKKYRRAYRWIQKAIEAGGNSPEIYEHMGDILYRLSRKKEAIEWWKKAIEAGGTNPALKKKVMTGEF